MITAKNRISGKSRSSSLGLIAQIAEKWIKNVLNANKKDDERIRSRMNVFKIWIVCTCFCVVLLFLSVHGMMNMSFTKKEVDGGEKSIENVVNNNISSFLQQYKPQFQDYQMVLIYWSTAWGRKGLSGYPDFAKQKFCNVTDRTEAKVYLNQKILVTDSKGLEKYANTFIFHGPDVGHGNLRPKKDPFADVYVYHTMESPAYHVSAAKDSVMDEITLLMDYHRTADIHLDYVVPEGLIKDKVKSVPWINKTKTDAYVAWCASNCGAQNGRQDYLRELFKYVPSHALCSCLNNYPKVSRDLLKLRDVISHYMFYVVIENSNCYDYITEKLNNAIWTGTIPIVFSPNGIPDYDRWLPPHSYINVADFQSAKALGEYLKRVAGNETLYNSYFEYKFNARKSEIHYQKELRKIQERRLSPELREKQLRSSSQGLTCNMVEETFNYIRAGKKKSVGADKTCLKRGSIRSYIDKTKKKISEENTSELQTPQLIS
eukprot:53803_1